MWKLFNYHKCTKCASEILFLELILKYKFSKDSCFLNFIDIYKLVAVRKKQWLSSKLKVKVNCLLFLFLDFTVNQKTHFQSLVRQIYLSIHIFNSLNQSCVNWCSFFKLLGALLLLFNNVELNHLFHLLICSQSLMLAFPIWWFYFEYFVH